MATAMASSWGGRISINGSKPQTPNTDRTSSDQAVMIPILVRPTLLTYSSAFENTDYRAAFSLLNHPENPQPETRL